MLYSQGVKKNIELRRSGPVDPSLESLDPVLQRIFYSRGITRAQQLDRSLKQLPSPWLFSGMEAAVNELFAALQAQQKIVIVADFDADGATSCSLAVRGLRLLGAQHVGYVVPNRFEYGYGLTPEIVQLAAKQSPNLIITVDNGISSIEGVEEATSLGIRVVVTDHHLPGEELPKAAAIVNPNLPEDRFPSKNIAGVGVIFYVLMALRSRLREQQWFDQQCIAEPNLAQLLDLVALGTVADVVVLDQINRTLVHQGLQRIRAGQCVPGIKALVALTKRSLAGLTAADLGYVIAPRLNAAGRIDDMSLGIQCLLADDSGQCDAMALKLEDLNRERKTIEEQMKTEAGQLLAEMKTPQNQNLPWGVCLFNPEWHQGVIGILASRIKDRLHRPVVAFAPSDKDEIKGSARSVPGVHIRDVLSDIATHHPKLLTKFGGHAMAAGLCIKMHDYPPFALAFDDMVAKRLQNVDMEQKIYSDGELPADHFSREFTELIQQAATWGQAFPEPLFHGVFDVIQCRVVGRQHLKFVLRLPFDELLLDAIGFFVERPEAWLGCRQITAVYKLDINEYRGERQLQLVLEYFENRA